MSRPEIGEELQSHPTASGGITDITFRNIPLELKAEPSRLVTLDDCKKYFDQTASYSIGLGKKVGLLAVFETSSKSSPHGVVEDDMQISTHQLNNSAIAIVTIIIRGGYPVPSSYSKR